VLGLLQTSGEFRVNRTREKQRSCLEWRIPIARSLDVFGLTDWRWPCPFPVNRAGPCVALSSCGVPLWRVAVFVNTEQPEPPFRNFDVGAGPPDKRRPIICGCNALSRQGIRLPYFKIGPLVDHVAEAAE